MPLIDKKISARLDAMVAENVADELVKMATSPDRFDTSDELLSFLTEGASLKLGNIAANALSLKPSTFIVWESDGSKAVLLDNAANKQYQVSIESLVKQFRNISKVIGEETGLENLDADDQPEFNLSIDKDSVDRTALLAGMERSGHTVTSLAKAVGVDPPAISRILRKPRKGGTDPGGRNPSLGLAAQVCGELKVPVTKAFSDIFGRESEYKPKQVKANSQSGQNKGLQQGGGNE